MAAIPGPPFWFRSSPPTDGNFRNPERGFYASLDLVEVRKDRWVREEGCTLAHACVRLDDYRERDLDVALLEAVAAGFDAARAARIKTVLRFSDNFGCRARPAIRTRRVRAVRRP